MHEGQEKQVQNLLVLHAIFSDMQQLEHFLEVEPGPGILLEIKTNKRKGHLKTGFRIQNAIKYKY